MVSLTMPVADPASAKLETHPVRILVADDHEVMRMVFVTCSRPFLVGRFTPKPRTEPRR